MESVLSFLRSCWRTVVPQIVTEDVAMVYRGEGPRLSVYSYDIECCMEDVEPHEQFDAVASVRSVSFFGYFGITYRVWNLRPWPGARPLV